MRIGSCRVNDEIRALLVRSREDVGLAEISRQDVGCLEKLVSIRVVCFEYQRETPASELPEVPLQVSCGHNVVKSVSYIERQKKGNSLNEQSIAFLKNIRTRRMEIIAEIHHINISLAASQIFENLDNACQHEKKFREAREKKGDQSWALPWLRRIFSASRFS
jgi:hypothetical protein